MRDADKGTPLGGCAGRNDNYSSLASAKAFRSTSALRFLSQTVANFARRFFAYTFISVKHTFMLKSILVPNFCIEHLRGKERNPRRGELRTALRTAVHDLESKIERLNAEEARRPRRKAPLEGSEALSK